VIHKFKCNDKIFVLDVPTGSLLEVDDTSFLCFGENEPTEKNYDIQELIDKGIIYTKDKFDNYELRRGDVPIKALCLNIAQSCNLRCRYCFAGDGNYGKDELMSFETAKKAIDFVVANSYNRQNIEVDFFGGEPLLNWEVIKKTVLYALTIPNKTFHFTITTNGILLDDEKMEFINEYMENLVLSLDGRKATNDKNRRTKTNEGTYDILVKNLLKFAKARGNKDYYIRGTYTKDNLDFSEDIKHLASLGFKNISLEPVVSEGQDYSITKDDLPAIFAEYEKFAKEYANVDYNFFHFMLDDTHSPCTIKRLSGCGAGCEYIAVSPNGDVYPCHQFVGEENMRLGNLEDGITNTELQEKIKNINVLTKNDCKKCWARYYCSGGCHANALHYGGSLDSTHDISCEIQKKRIECALYVKSCK